MKLIWLSFFILFSVSTFGQIASASLFRQMRSQNPAVITKRPAATVSLAVAKDQVDKTQDVVGTNFTNSTSEIDITTTSFFYGGQGKNLNTEVSAELSSGKKMDSVSVASVSNTTTSEADLMVIDGKIALLQFLGVGLMRVTEDRTQSGTSTGTYDTSVTAITLGTQFNLGLDLGLFYTSTTFEQKGQFDGSSINQDIDMPRVGAGVGKTGKAYHFEVGYVKDLKAIAEDQGGGSGPGSNSVAYNPAKYFLALEFKWGGLMLGVTSNYYMDGFFDFNNLMYYTMVLSANKENRLENTFNFSLGGEKGHSFSGGFTYSTVESQELPATLSSGQKFTTTSKILGVSASYTYNF